MYLSGLGVVGIDVRMPDGSVQSFNEITPNLDAALQVGTPLIGRATQFAGGWLINGCPLNVVLGRGWLPGQQEALRSAGILQCLPAAPGYNAPPVIQQVAPIDFKVPATPDGTRILPTGVSTPSAPEVIVTSSGPVYLPAEPAETVSEETVQDAPGMSVLLLAGLGIGLVGILLGRRR